MKTRDYTDCDCFCGHDFQAHCEQPDNYSERYCRVPNCSCIEFDNNFDPE